MIKFGYILFRDKWSLTFKSPSQFIILLKIYAPPMTTWYKIIKKAKRWWRLWTISRSAKENKISIQKPHPTGTTHIITIQNKVQPSPHKNPKDDISVDSVQKNNVHALPGLGSQCCHLKRPRRVSMTTHGIFSYHRIVINSLPMLALVSPLWCTRSSYHSQHPPSSSSSPIATAISPFLR